MFCSQSQTHQSFLNTCQQGEIARCLIFTTLWFSWSTKWQKNDPVRKYVSFLKHVTSNYSHPQSVLDSSYERFLLGSVWTQTMRNRSIEIGAWRLCSWWHHEGQDSDTEHAAQHVEMGASQPCISYSQQSVWLHVPALSSGFDPQTTPLLGLFYPGKLLKNIVELGW